MNKVQPAHININHIQVHTIDTLSGIFTGSNHQTGWSSVSKTNVVFRIDGKNNIVSSNNCAKVFQA